MSEATTHDLPTPAMHHRRHSRAISSLMAAVTSGGPVTGYQAVEARRFLEAVARLINHDPTVCYRIEAAARGEAR